MASKLSIYLAIFLLASPTVAININSQSLKNTKVSISLHKANPLAFFKLIEQQTDFTFVYDNTLKYNKSSISIHHKNISVQDVLEKLSKEASLSFMRINNNISVKVVSKKEKKVIIKEPVLKKISGNVKDQTGTPLPGVNIIVKGTLIGTTTDFDGNFTLQVPDDATIITASYLGYKTQEITISNKSSFEIVLQEDSSQLNEVVVVGYGSTTKEKFNGSVSKIDSKSLNNFSTANFEQAIAGNIAGVQIVGNTKNPGDNSVIQIRGLSTLTAGANPLIVVDGIPLTEGSSFSSINNQDIESINILKDAASAAIYGSRASNGVVLITTKKGKTGKLKVTFDTYLGIQNRIDNFKLVDAYDYALFDNDARNFGYLSGDPGRNINDSNAVRDANGGGKRSRIQPFLQSYINGESGLVNTNWQDAVFRPATQMNHHINLSGGTKKTNYSISFGYLDQENIVISSDYQRYTNNIKINSKITDKVRVGVTSNVSLANSNPTGEAGWSNYGLGAGRQPDPSFSTILMQPYYPIYNSDGSYAIANQINDNNDNWDGPISENTIAQTELTDFFERRFRVFGSTYLEADIFKGLTFKTSFSGDFNTIFSEFFAPSNIGNYRTPVESNFTQAFENNFTRDNYITENTLNYKNTFGKHDVNALLGYSYQEENTFNTRIEGNNFADDNIRNISGAINPLAISTRSKWALESYFARLQYQFDNKYSLSASIRYDGSSRFGANTKYGNFASLSAGWVISNEDFFPTEGFLNYAKLRASWGQTGNNQIGNFGSIALVSPDNYVIDETLLSGSYTATSPNPDLSWETNTSLNFGVDLRFLDSKIQVSAEYYQAKTDNLLLQVPVPQQSGFSNSLQNIGELENKGFELELKGIGFSLGNVNMNFNANISTNENKVLALAPGQEQIIVGNGGMSFLTRVGESIAQFYAYDIIGVYTNQAEIDNEAITPLSGTEVGDYIVRDANGDGQITPDDRVILGDYNPDFTYGFGVSLNYKGFDLNAQFTGVEGRKAADRMVYFAESGEGFFVPTQHYFDNYFNDRNANGFFRRPDFSSFSSAGRLTRASSLSVLDADYFRLRSLQLGYSLPDTTISYLGMDQLRVYLTGNNIFNISDYRGYNPDGIDTRTNSTQTLTRGWIQTTSPLTRFVALGVNVKF
ncbi:SusC-like TonB-dependent outer membrane receptor precursor [Tenacibaculum xiamenense]